MTDPEMNASLVKKIGPIAALALAAVTQAACAVAVGPYATRTDLESPLSARVEALVDANREYPRWADFPRTPTDLPQSGDIAAQVATLQVDANALGQEIDAMTWEAEEAASLSARLRARVDGAEASPATAETAADVEAFARRLRERATPPPPLN